MNFQSNQDRISVVLKLITTIDEYYDCSFRVRNDRCFVILIKLIEQVEELLQLVHSTEEQIGLRGILNNIANAMANKDYVLIRDLLHYELRSKLHALKN